MEWPYPVRYHDEIELETDVLVLGGGIAGCFAAIAAAKAGSRVIVLEKGAALRSGSGGTGCDHWINTPHPDSSITAEEILDWEVKFSGGYCNGISRYIAARESYETLLELEAMGGKIRDTSDEFEGAAFRDEKSKFLFAYDYENRIHFRVWGSTFKPALYKACRELKVNIKDRLMVTALLTANGMAGERVIGAMALHTRTGAFYIIKAGAVINCLSRHQRNWAFSTELRGISSFRPPQIVGDGHAMAWRAGAEFTMMEKSVLTSFGSGNVLPPYSHGNCLNTWFPCSMIDAKGSEIPYQNRDNMIIPDPADRTRPAPGQKFLGERTTDYEYKRPELIGNLKEKIEQGEYTLPLYADLPGMSEMDRKAIWGLMVGEEGKTGIPVRDLYQIAGFDPEMDLLQSYMFLGSDPMRGSVRPQERTGGEIGDAGGLFVDWELKTNLEGFYAAGDALFAGNYFYHAATTGRYAGKNAARFAAKVNKFSPNREQIKKEKTRIYLPLGKKGRMEWKELNMAMCRIMQDYCSEYKNEELLNIGLAWFDDIEKNELSHVSVDNPHQLVRTLEVFNVLTCNRMILQASLARKASSKYLHFHRLDYPELDPEQWRKWIVLKNLDGTIEQSAKPLNFWQSLVDIYESHRS